MSIAWVCLLPFLAAAIPPLTIRFGRTACALSASGASLVSLLLLLSMAPDVWGGIPIRTSVPWIAGLGLNFSFSVDALALFFASLILVIGLLVIAYARFYLAEADPMGRFYAYMLLFQGAMLGIVLSDNILLLAIFWELTSLSSFLLIGYWRGSPDARRGARMALIVTGGGGLALIAGLLLLGYAAGTFEISEIIQRGETIRGSALYTPLLLLILVGAFAKSAQFPFHFWLPHAMAAPTPVSAYLHSATMVKAGVFLLARLWPALSGTDAWFLIVTGVGLATMLIGAWIALFKDDLKAILAYSTVSHLGLMTMLLGMGTKTAATIAVFHILNHATFKAALFMSAGIVDHETHTRDIKRLGGLIWLMPISGTLALIATASMAGVPLLNGFLSKEMMLEAVYETNYAGIPGLLAALALVAALLSVAYSARFAFGVYLGAERHDYPHHPHDPPAGMWAPVALLVAAVVLIGILPALLSGGLVTRTAQAVVGGEIPPFKPALWHGVTPALVMSIIAFAGGYLAYRYQKTIDAVRMGLPRPDGRMLFECALGGLIAASRRLNARLHTESLSAYVATIVCAILVVGFAAFFTASHGPGARPTLPVSIIGLTMWAFVLASCAAVVIWHNERLLALIVVSVIGFIVCLVFVQFSAPDLALTQISVEVVTTILMLLALNLLPRRTPGEAGAVRKARDGAIAIACGFGVAMLSWFAMTRDVPSIASYHLAESKPQGGGTNVVNVILVDFRGFDTFGEIIVLCIAALAIYALLDSALKGAAARRLAAMRQGEESGDAHSFLLVIATRVLLPLALVVGVYIFLRGHNQPGGGFIAGLVVAISLLMQAIASGYQWTARRSRINAHVLLGSGVLIAGATGAGAFAFGRPFLTSAFGYFHIPLVGEVELATAAIFDLGVFLTVVGTVVLAIAQISRVEARAERVPTPEGPLNTLDVDQYPARAVEKGA
ncbi:MAG: monovalent cation/H+ antiporter subunit A [Beijerinckiaceae bacterium]